MKPSISVIIPNYNNAQYLVECVDSVYSQTFKPIECIVIDDGSSDNSIDVLSSLQKHYTSLQYYFQENSGPSVARNFGIKRAKGEYIALLDADDFWGPNKLANQVNLLEQLNPKRSIITSHNDFINDKADYLALSNFMLPPYTIFDALTKNIAIGSCSSILFPKTVIDDLGGYDPILRGSEDQDFHFRLLFHGFQFYHVHETDVHIRIHPGNTTKSYIKNIYFHLLALDKQVELLESRNSNYLRSNQFKVALIGRIGNIYYWAKKLKREDIMLFLRKMLLRYLGPWNYYKHRFFTKLLSIKRRM